MSQVKEEDDVDPSSIHVISDSTDSSRQDSGFTPNKRFSTDVEKRKSTHSARKKLKIDGDRVEANDEVAIDIDSISTNPRRTRTCTKVSSDTSSKFPVSSPSDAMVVASHRKKYVKNTLPAGSLERMLATVAQSHPLMTYQEKLVMWDCCNDLSDVEDVNNFDDQFQKRELKYKKKQNKNGSPDLEYNYQHFRTVILENLKGSPTAHTPSPDLTRTQNNTNKPSCSKQLDAVFVAFKSGVKTEPSAVIQHDKILCPSSESSPTKASPSIHLHWTDEDSVFRLNRQNPEIDKYSKLIKIRVDYKKQVNLKAKMNEIFKTPTVPLKYNNGCDSPEQRKSLESTNDIKSLEEHINDVQEETIQKIVTRRSAGRKSADNRRGVERKSTDRKSSDKLPEVTSFQQDEFCNYLGLGMNGKVYSPTQTDNKRRSLRVRRQQQQVEPIKKKKEKEMKKNNEAKKSEEDQIVEKDAEVTTTVTETRNSLPSPLTIKILERTRTSEEAKTPLGQQPPATGVTKTNKTSEIKILLQISSSPTAQTPPRNTRSTTTTPNSAPLPTRRLRRTRTTSNGTSTCPRSSQSDESPSKVITRRKRLNTNILRHNNTSDRSESLHSDHQVHDNSPMHNGRSSTVPSSEERKDDIPSTSHTEVAQVGTDNLHAQFQRYLEDSRKSRPSIFIVDSIESNGPKAQEEVLTDKNEVCEEQPKNRTTTLKGKKWSKRKKNHRRLLRRNGAFGGFLNQRILRNRKIVRPLRTKIRQPLGKRVNPTKNKSIKSKLTEKMKTRQTRLQNSTEKQSTPHEEIEVPMERIYNDKSIQTENEIEPHNKSQGYNVIEMNSKEKPATVDVQIQTESCTPPLSITRLTSPPSYSKNPLSSENGDIIYAYHELDVLTVVQERVVTFWKTCKLLQLLSKPTCEWVYLGECKRLLIDEEINAPYKNRICVHNSIPIYMEMRAKEMDKIRRECNIISVYINVYYYHDEDLVAKSHSIQLDTVASIPESVVYTTISDSRYFVMCWSQETILGKPRSGLCKYSLTPHLDTLASIREFKSMRHEIRYLECTTDDNLIGFGDTHVTLWDHRSGDILMNYDLDFQLGTNVGSIYYPSLEVGQDNTVLIFQKTSVQELSIIAINISHSSPTHRLVCTHTLPPEFSDLKSSIRTEDYVILTNAQHQELWIDCANPQYMIKFETKKGLSRFYARCKQVIDIADDHLALESFSSFVLKMMNVLE